MLILYELIEQHCSACSISDFITEFIDIKYTSLFCLLFEKLYNIDLFACVCMH